MVTTVKPAQRPTVPPICATHDLFIPARNRNCVKQNIIFLTSAQYTDYLKAWTRSSALQQEVSNKLSEWLEGGLKAWDISRDAPYFGFLIPGTLDKYFYVWMDAPIGYMASFKNFCDSNGNINFDDFWNPQSNCEVHHFIGKDIINFHALFWPSVLDGADFRTADPDTYTPDSLP